MSTTLPVEFTWGASALRVDLWDRYDLALSMLDAGTAWTLTAWGTASLDGTAWGHLIHPTAGVKLGDPVWFKIDGEVVLTGRVETLEMGDSPSPRGGFDVTLSGRDLAGPAISWDADPTLSFKGRVLPEALEALFDALDLPVRLGEHVDAEAPLQGLRARRRGRFTTHLRTHARAVDVTHPKIGDRVWQVAERIVRGLGYRLFVAPSEDGTCNVVVDTPRYSGDPVFTFTRELGPNGMATANTNLLSGREVYSLRDVPTEVTVFASGKRGDLESARIARTVSNGWLANLDVTRGRVSAAMPPQPRFLRSDQAKTPEAAHKEAAHVIAEAMERFRIYKGAVQGHAQNGRLYHPNALCDVRDDVLNLRERMLLTRCNLKGGRQIGQRTEVELSPYGALSLDPVT